MMLLLKIIGFPGLIMTYLVVIPILTYKGWVLHKEGMSIFEIQDYYFEQIESIKEVLNHGTIVFSVLFYAYIYWLIFY